MIRRWINLIEAASNSSLTGLFYHGTSTNKPRSTTGLYVGNDAALAANYAKSAAEHYGGSPVVLKGHLEVEHPMVVSADHIEWLGYDDNEILKLSQQGFDCALREDGVEVFLFSHAGFIVEDDLRSSLEEAYSRETDHRIDATKTIPDVVYHGTNILAALMILKSGQFVADHPSDDEGLGACVSVTSSFRIAQMFAVEFVRINSEHDVGVVFELDGKAIRALHGDEIVAYNADTAGKYNEEEFRILGAVPLKGILRGFKLVGEVEALEDRTVLRDMYEDENFAWKFQRAFSWDQFRAGVRKLRKNSSL